MFANNIQFESFVNHFTSCKQCRPQHGIYCAVGRELWIDDKAAFIANMDNINDRRYWLAQIEKNDKKYITEIKKRLELLFLDRTK